MPTHEPGEQPVREEEWREVRELAERNRPILARVAPEVAECLSRVVTAAAAVGRYFEVARLDEISLGKVADPRIDFGDAAVNADFAQLTDSTDAVLEGLSAADRLLARARFLAGELGYVPPEGSNPEHIYDSLLSNLDSLARVNAAVGLDANVVAAMRSQLAIIYPRNDPRGLWAGIATRCDESLARGRQPSWPDEMIAMGFLARLNPVPEAWLWESQATVAERVRALIGGDGAPLSPAIVYHRAADIAARYNIPTAAMAEVVRLAFGVLAPQPPISLGTPIRVASISRVKQATEGKLVFVLTGRAGGRFVVKFEMKLPSETKENFCERREAVQALAEACLPNVPPALQLGPEEISALRILGEQRTTLEPNTALTILNAPDDKYVAVKMEFVEGVVTLSKLVDTRMVPDGLLGDASARSLGRIAAFDLLVGNLDRFSEKDEKTGACANLENIEFRQTSSGYEAVALDNLWQKNILQANDPVAVPRAREALAALKNHDSRCQYANDVLAWLVKTIGWKKVPQGSSQAFQEGMAEALKAMKKMPIIGVRNLIFYGVLKERFKEITID